MENVDRCRRTFNFLDIEVDIALRTPSDIALVTPSDIALLSPSDIALVNPSMNNFLASTFDEKIRDLQFLNILT